MSRLTEEQQSALKKAAGNRGFLRAGAGAAHEKIHARTLKALVKKGLVKISREQELENRWHQKTGKVAFSAQLTPEGRKLAGMDAEVLPLDKWLDEVHELVKAKDAFCYSSDRLGSPKFGNAIDVLCYEKGMSPREALNWWRKQ